MMLLGLWPRRAEYMPIFSIGPASAAARFLSTSAELILIHAA